MHGLTKADWSRDWKKPPNIVTLGRLASTPVIAILIFLNTRAVFIPEEDLFAQITESSGAVLLELMFWPTWLFLIAALTDKLDGWLAKRNNRRWATELGAQLDPLVDKALMALSIIPALVVVIIRQDWLGIVGLGCLVIFLAFREFDVARLKTAATAIEGVKSAIQRGRVSMVVICIAISVVLLPIEGFWTDRIKLLLIFVAIGFSAWAWAGYRQLYGKYLDV